MEFLDRHGAMRAPAPLLSSHLQVSRLVPLRMGIRSSLVRRIVRLAADLRIPFAPQREDLTI